MPRLVSCVVIILSWIGLPVKGGGAQRMVPTKRDKGIPIHPPREGRDRVLQHSRRRQVYFNPPSPCGEGRGGGVHLAARISISIHPPRVGRDIERFEGFFICFPFQSTLPVWGGTMGRRYNERHRTISIHPPRVGRDGVGSAARGPNRNFNPPSPWGEGQ